MANLTPRARIAYGRDMTFRLYNPATKKFLHLSGAGETKGTDYAWLGYRYQAMTLIQRAAVRGGPFPFEVVDA